MNKLDIGINLAAMLLLLENNTFPEELLNRVRLATANNSDMRDDDISAEELMNHILTNLGV